MLSLSLYMLQRLSALVMVPLVVAHIALMIYAIADGLTASEILDRTRGSVAWFAFYGLFVVAVSIHGAIGLRVIVSEWFAIGRGAADVMTWSVGLVLLALGMRAVWGVTFGVGA